jgi:hypothetical protein
MNQLAMGQYSVTSGEKAILEAGVSGNAFVQVSEPMVETAPNHWECIVGNDNIVIRLLVTFPDSTPGSRVDLTIDGEIHGQRGNGPFSIFPILPSSAKKDPALTLFVS